MSQLWKPSRWGRLFTRSEPWVLQLEDESLQLHRAGATQRFTPGADSELHVRPGLLWSRLHLQPDHGPALALHGLPNAPARRLHRAIEALLQQREARDRVPTFQRALAAMRAWNGEAEDLLTRREAERRWIAHDCLQALLARRPVLRPRGKALRTLFLDPDVHATAEDRDAALIELQLWEQDWAAASEAANARILAAELEAARPLLARVESRPLSEEQSRAVIVFDNRVQVVAAAGSGKTSTMVAKAAYAVQRRIAEPEAIILLAFNKEAATELQQRADTAFARVGLGGSRVQARTFHALGLAIIGKATGRKPDVPDWAVDATLGFRKLAELVDGLKDRSFAFRAQWDMFRLVFGRDLPALGHEGAADGWDKEGSAYLRTLNGERVRSMEECVLADWLFYNGVAYQYERRYAFDTATDTFRQYRPDFFYPQADLYHEHLALDAQGNPPPHFEGYAEGIAWKREEHRRRGTALVETTSHGLRTGEAFDDLEDALSARGIVLDPNPDREIPDDGQKPMPDADLIGLVRTFISHAKSNCLSLDDLAARLRALPEDQFKERHRRFLQIVAPVLEAWDDALRAERAIDFEDMLNQAAEHLEQGRYASPYTLVMADEFQDASRARARLCRALVQAPGTHFFAVGDDWQSINRFAGADVSVMTGFREWFGHGQVLRLEQTFRCPQALCDVSSRFISANPAQLRKQVHSRTPAHGPVLQAFQVASRDQISDGIAQYLQHLHEQRLTGTVPPGRDGKLSVFVVGRYNADRAQVPGNWKARFGATLEVSFITAHRSKGTEADYVILPGMVDRGFPNLRADDPVLGLAMPHGDDFPLGEERRLFYVALTRARRSVAMFTVSGKRSAFLTELVRAGAVEVTRLDGEPLREQPCPACDTGVIVTKTGRYGEFAGCTGYPRCEYKPTTRVT
ncbi:UvrD-helicase domain-containing protein [Xanthomonas sp. 60]